MRYSKSGKQCQPTLHEDALREQLEACYNEQEVLAQQHQMLLVERDLLYKTLMQVAVTDVITGLPNHQAVINRLDEAIEEFVILLPGVDVQAATLTAEHLRTVIGASSFSWQPDTNSSAVPIPTTVSIGVAIYPLHGLSAETLFEAADRAMYHAKYIGRNHVYLADMGMASTQSMHDDREYMAVLALTAAASVHDHGTEAHAQRLTDEEWLIMRQHPELGCQVLEQVGGIFGQLATIVGTHHEHLDGLGYPYGLANEAIPMTARILSVVDAYDAMISSRPYRREPLTVVEAKTELIRCAGSQYDPHVVKTFLSVLQEQENRQSTLEEAKAPDTSDQPNSTIPVPIIKVQQPGTEWRQQQLVLQQRIEACQQHQHYLVWRQQERERRRQVIYTEASR